MELERKEERKDAWTGKYDWSQLFSVENFWRLVIFLFFVYLFLKYLLPLIKKSFNKA